MEPTVFGALVVAIAPFLLLFGSLEAMLYFVLMLTLLGGASAVTLTSLGGSSIMPANFAMFFFILQFILPGHGRIKALSTSLSANAVLVVFVLYGSIGAYVLPRIFAHAMYVTPLHPHPTHDPFASEPLVFTNQNVTISVYFLQTMLAAVGAYIVARRYFVPADSADENRGRAALNRLATVAALICSTHAVLGFLSVVAKDRLGPLFTFFRNGSYAQLNQDVDEVSRMNGIFPEPSNFAAYGFAWMVFTAELWLRDVRPRWTGPAAALMAAALVVSTSSTGYLGLAAYGAVLVPRLILIRRGTPPGKGLLIFAGGLAGLTAVLVLAVAVPSVGAKLGHLLSTATLAKVQSASALQRGFWARQGIDAFVVSKGIGIGCGSFRSSSIVTAILGCMGVVGIVTFALYLARVFMPLRRSTWICRNDPAFATGAAASWTAVMMLAPLCFTAPSPDPGVLWGLLCGLALALREPPVFRNEAKSEHDLMAAFREPVTTFAQRSPRQSYIETGHFS